MNNYFAALLLLMVIAYTGYASIQTVEHPYNPKSVWYKES